MNYSDLDLKIRKNHKFSFCNELTIEKFPMFFADFTIKSFPKIEHPSELNSFRKIHITEPQHSSILGDLLNPQGSHQQGDIFLKFFFDVLGIKYKKEDLWSVNIETERFDIRIATKLHDKIIIIENKSNWADDQPNQLYRYWFYGIYLPQIKFQNDNGCFKKILYLSPSDFKYPSDQTLKRPDDFEVTLPETVPIPIDVIFFNNEIVKWLSKCMDAVKEVPEIYYFIKQYLDYWRNK